MIVMMSKEVFIMSKYEVHKELIKRYRKAGLTVRDLANALNEPPGTTSNRIYGWVPMSKRQEDKIIETIKEAEGKMPAQGELDL